MKTIGIRGISDLDFCDRENKYGVSIDSVVVYQAVQALSMSNVQQVLNHGKQVQLVIEFHDSFANLNAIAQGLYDNYLHAFINDLRKDGRHLWVRPLHELNSDWYSWGIYKPGNTIGLFISAWKHIVQVFRSSKANVSFQLCYNYIDPCDKPARFELMYPGDNYVDAVGVNVYNRAGLDQWHTTYPSFQALFTPAYARLTNLTRKPLFIGEMSATSYGGDKCQWITDAFNAWSQFPQVVTMNWFLESKQEGPVWGDWNLTTAEQEQAWIRGVRGR